jgi:hypothetical protein
MAQSRVAGHAQQVELADDIAEDDCAIAWHSDTHYSLLRQSVAGKADITIAPQNVRLCPKAGMPFSADI